MGLAFETSECFSSALEQISRLDGQCYLSCNILDVPIVPLDPDQRDIQFPAITPNQDINIRRAGGCVPSPTNTGDSLGPTGSSLTTQATADTMPWDRTEMPGAGTANSVFVMTRAAIDTGSGVLYAYFREYKYDSCGGLKGIGPEQRHSIATIGPCP